MKGDNLIVRCCYVDMIVGFVSNESKGEYIYVSVWKGLGWCFVSLRMEYRLVFMEFGL